MVAPKGSGLSVRAATIWREAASNSSFAIHQDYTGRAEEKAVALGIAIGSGYLFYTTFEKEVYSDLVGERGVLMGAIAGIMEAQYAVLRKHGHSPSEAFNETVEEFTQSLIKLAAEKGMDWLYANCSTTSQRGAWTGKGYSVRRLLPCLTISIKRSPMVRKPKSYSIEQSARLPREVERRACRNEQY